MSLFKKKEAKHPEMPDGAVQGPFTPEEMTRLHGLVDEVGTGGERGFIIVVKRTTLQKDDTSEQSEIDGIVKVSKVNRKFVLDTIFHALGMENKDIIEYATMRAVVGTDFQDGCDHKHD